MSCSHIDSAELRLPLPNEAVYREDCTQCFDSIDDSGGLNVCLSCFNGGCVSDRNHALLHYETYAHPLTLNIKRKRKHVSRDEPPQKMSKLAIAAETEQDRYDTTTSVHCYACELDDIDVNSSDKLAQVVDAVMKANTFARQEEVKAWEQEIVPCQHTRNLQQNEPRHIASQDLGQCAMCDLKENLWLCLTCGNLGCGRAQFGGVGGNSHALTHSDQVSHPVAVKLGSLTADGQADIYCYACNDERTDLDLPSHLANFGINIAERQKTEKSLTEMQIEQNLRWEFSMTDQHGAGLQPLFGPGFTGLKNLGNSCYLASVVQCLFNAPQFQTRYYKPKDMPPAVSKPADDLETQLQKMADGLLSGRYSYPDSDIITSEDFSETPHQKGLAPSMLKHLIGRGHPEFSTMRQQDASELLLHLLKLIGRSQHPNPQSNPISAFQFAMEQRLQCLGCRKVRYQTIEMENVQVYVPVRRIPKDASNGETNGNADKNAGEEFEPVTIQECFDILTASERVEHKCSSCGNDGFSKRTLFKTFPQILAVTALRFDTVVNWVPTKLDVPVIVGDDPISFDKYKSHGLQPTEELLPEEATVTTTPASSFVANELALAQLEAMGFPRIRCEKALKATGNTDAEAASNWLFEHMDDPHIDVPDADQSGASGASAGSTGPDPSQIEDLTNMGFNAPQARQALKETGGSMERAVDWLFSHPDAPGDFGDESNQSSTAPVAPTEEKDIPGSGVLPANMQLQSIVCHKGTSIHSGHYVAFIRKHITNGSDDTAWILYNDEKVARAPDVDEMKKFAYIYFFHRL